MGSWGLAKGAISPRLGSGMNGLTTNLTAVPEHMVR